MLTGEDTEFSHLLVKPGDSLPLRDGPASKRPGRGPSSGGPEPDLGREAELGE